MYIFRLEKVQAVDPENEKIYFNMAMLAMDGAEYDRAHDWFIKAIGMGKLSEL